MPSESLSSLIYRLTQANSYDRTGRIYRLIDLPRRFGRNRDLLSDRNIIKKLALINNCSENEIFNTTTHSFARYLSDDKSGVFNRKEVKKFVLRSSTQYCPLCLKESGYHKIYWELLPVSICMKHEVILQNICPKCHHPVKANWVLGNKCLCGSDLLSADPVSVTSYKETIRNQIFIQNRLGINESRDLKIVSEFHKSPATKLSPPDFFKLLDKFSILLNKLPESSEFLKVGSITATRPRDRITTKISISNHNNFILINSAASILLDWPQKFYEFLEEYSKIRRSDRHDIGVQRYFGGIKEILLDKLNDRKFGFIYHAYRDYLNEYWTGGHLGKIKVFDMQENQKIEKKHITLEEADEILKVGDYHLVPRLINQKIIRAVVHEAGSVKRYVVDAESVYTLKGKIDKLLTYSDITERLDIDVHIIRSLMKSGLLTPFKESWYPSHRRLFEPEEVERFWKEFLSEERYPIVDKKPGDYLSIAEAMKAISNTGTGVSTSRLLHLVREDIFNPILCKEGKGLSRLLFSKDELRKYREADSEKQRDHNKFTVYRVGEILGIDMRFVQHFIDIGLIKATVESVDGEQITYILREDLGDFKSEYLFIEDAAALIGYNTETIFQWTKQGRLKDYSGIPVTRRTSLRILRREEIIPFMPEKSMNVLQAAEYLGVLPGSVHRLIRKNILPTLRGKGLGETSYSLIPLEEITYYKKNFLNSIKENYMGVGQAAKYLGIHRNTIYRLINKKILSAIKCKWKCRTLIPLQELVNYKSGLSRNAKGSEIRPWGLLNDNTVAAFNNGLKPSHDHIGPFQAPSNRTGHKRLGLTHSLSNR